MKLTLSTLALCTLTFLALSPSQAAPKTETLDDLKKLEITCLVPAWLPEGYQLKKVEIDRSDREGEGGKARIFPGYSTEYSNGKKGRFTIESARWGIGDRNLDQNDRAEESEFDSKRYGKVYIIYFPPGKSGVKNRIAANWIEDENLKAEKPGIAAKQAKNQEALPIKGRFHGLSGYGMTLAEFQKIVQSLHPLGEK
jgi:hypothetical protein